VGVRRLSYRFGKSTLYIVDIATCLFIYFEYFEYFLFLANSISHHEHSTASML
jgi:hypothetical protein